MNKVSMSVQNILYGKDHSAGLGGKRFAFNGGGFEGELASILFNIVPVDMRRVSIGNWKNPRGVFSAGERTKKVPRGKMGLQDELSLRTNNKRDAGGKGRHSSYKGVLNIDGARNLFDFIGRSNMESMIKGVKHPHHGHRGSMTNGVRMAATSVFKKDPSRSFVADEFGQPRSSLDRVRGVFVKDAMRFAGDRMDAKSGTKVRHGRESNGSTHSAHTIASSLDATQAGDSRIALKIGSVGRSKSAADFGEIHMEKTGQEQSTSFNINNSNAAYQSGMPEFAKRSRMKKISLGNNDAERIDLVGINGNHGRKGTTTNTRAVESIAFHSSPLTGRKTRHAKGAYRSEAASPDSRVISQLEDGIIEHVTAMYSNGREYSEVKLKLYPPELGEVKIKVSLKGKKVKASFHVDNGRIKAIIDSGLDRLQEAFAKEGFALEHFDVSVAGHDRRDWNDGEFEDVGLVDAVRRNGFHPSSHGSTAVSDDRVNILV